MPTVFLRTLNLGRRNAPYSAGSFQLPFHVIAFPKLFQRIFERVQQIGKPIFGSMGKRESHHVASIFWILIQPQMNGFFDFCRSFSHDPRWADRTKHWFSASDNIVIVRPGSFRIADQWHPAAEGWPMALVIIGVFGNDWAFNELILSEVKQLEPGKRIDQVFLMKLIFTLFFERCLDIRRNRP